MNTFGFTGDIEKRDAASHQLIASIKTMLLATYSCPKLATTALLLK
jgi:hypothetical protein